MKREKGMFAINKVVRPKPAEEIPSAFTPKKKALENESRFRRGGTFKGRTKERQQEGRWRKLVACTGGSRTVKTNASSRPSVQRLDKGRHPWWAGNETTKEKKKSRESSNVQGVKRHRLLRDRKVCRWSRQQKTRDGSWGGKACLHVRRRGDGEPAGRRGPPQRKGNREK